MTEKIIMHDVFRSPDSAFRNLPDFPYEPNYLEWDGLRTHYVDEGPKDAPVAARRTHLGLPLSQNDPASSGYGISLCCS